MSATLTNAMDALRVERWTFATATTWKVTRRDGEVLRLTDHDTTITLDDGYDYDPVGAFSSSAHASESGLKVRNIEFSGPIAAGYVTQDDLRVGRYDDAEVEERWVDWRYPFKGYFRRWYYWITQPEYDQEEWKAEGVGLAYRFTHPVGDVYSRTCRWDLGEAFGDSTRAGCKFDVDSFTIFNTTVSSVSDTTLLDGEVNARLRFLVNTSGISNEVAGTYTNGTVEWQSGANEGLVSEVYTCAQTTASTVYFEVALVSETPYDIVADDVLILRPGCDGTTDTCKTVFSNFANFGGQHAMPGTDGVLRTGA